MEVEKSSSGLVRSLSLKDSVMIGIASMIGGAIFVLVGPGTVSYTHLTLPTILLV